MSQAQAGPNEAAAELSKHVTKFVGQDLSQTKITDLDRQLGQKGQTKEQPWSGSYWALYSGSVAWPYSVAGTNYSRFRSNFETFNERLPQIREAALKGTLAGKTLEDLSATEKYDLYLGDTDFTLTRAVWQSIDDHAKIKHGVQEWEGICHGWSTASAYVKRPVHKVVVPSLDGKWLIPFYPDDLKALVTLLWANSLIQDFTQVEGLRCHTDSPEFDESSGKVTETSCKGVNPAVWHLAVLGLVGKQQKSFIINKNNNKEIWNQPVSRYELKYFNPSRGRYGSLEESIESLRRSRDDFSNFRGDKAAFLVGVEMTLYYTSETDPDHHEVDSKDQDLIEKMVLRYDLELDDQQRIIGGEWLYTNQPSFDLDEFKLPEYPGFIWRFQNDNPIAMSVGDVGVPFAGIQTLPQATRLELARKAATFKYQRYTFDDAGKQIPDVLELRPQPLGSVVYPLIEWAHH